MKIQILFEDNHCLVLNKPAGVLSQADATGDPCVSAWARGYLKERYQKLGNVYIGLIHRLDRPTSGAILLARTSKAAGRLSSQFRQGGISKVYWAIVEGRPHPAEGCWRDVLRKDTRSNRVRIVDSPSPEGQVAEVSYQVLEAGPRFTKLELRPATGRGHQLRVQLASRGFPILGDRKYGATSLLKAQDGGRRIALHARQLCFVHPTREEEITVIAPLPEDWPLRASESSAGPVVSPKSKGRRAT
jgi:23S rRNA pseudouridine1911/1915/1917 synthase